MTYPELKLIDANIRPFAEFPDGRRAFFSDSDSSATRLIACWNACREMDDPAKEVAGLVEIAEANNSLRSALSRRDEVISSMGQTIDSLRSEIDRMRISMEASTYVCADTPDPCAGLDSAPCNDVQTISPLEHLAYQLLRAIVRDAK